MRRQRTLRDLRQEAGLSQNDLGEKIGCSRSMLSLFERGGILPNEEQFEALVKILGEEVRDVIMIRTEYEGGKFTLPACKQNRRNCCCYEGGQCICLRETTFNRPCPFFMSREDHAKIMAEEAKKRKGRPKYYVRKVEQK